MTRHCKSLKTSVHAVENGGNLCTIVTSRKHPEKTPRICTQNLHHLYSPQGRCSIAHRGYLGEFGIRMGQGCAFKTMEENGKMHKNTIVI